MTLYSILLFIHVTTAVGGLGQISAIGVMTRTSANPDPAVLRQFLRAGSGSLIVMLLSGIGMVWLVNWSYASTGWFQVSMVLFLLLGGLLGMGQRTLRKATAGSGADASAAMKSLNRLAIAMSLTLTALVFLMEVKPF